MAHYSGGGAHGKFPTEPTDTMIVRNLDLNSTEKSISDAFGYITKELFIENTRQRSTLNLLVEISF